MFCGDGRSQPATDIEMTGDLEPARFAGGDHVIEDLVGDGFMKGSLIPIGPQIKFCLLYTSPSPRDS